MKLRSIKICIILKRQPEERVVFSLSLKQPFVKMTKETPVHLSLVILYKALQYEKIPCCCGSEKIRN